MKKKSLRAKSTPSKIDGKLKTANIRITNQRREILSILEKSHGPFSCEEIHKKLPKNFCDLVTVYRSMEKLEHSNLVTSVNFQDGIMRYETQHHHHHHVICIVCKKIEVLEGCFLGPAEADLQKKGYKNLKHHLEVLGVCPKCA